MVKTGAICLAALVLCSACIVTKEDIDCWYEDMCMNLADDAASVATPPQP